MGTIKPHPPIQCLDYPDFFHLRAAEGWFELGNIEEAHQELDRISSKQRSHAEALHLRWRILSQSNNLDRCLVIAQALAKRFPEDLRSWLTLAETFYLSGDIRKAYAIASAKAVEFPESWNLLYDTACYACLLGKFDEAKRFFELAMLVGDARAIRSKARHDPHLEALWRSLSRSPRKTTAA